MGSLVPKQDKTDVPEAPPPPPPVAPPPSKTEQTVDQSKKSAAEKKKFQKGYDKTILSQTGTQGKAKKTKLGT